MPARALVIIDMLNDFVLPGAPLEVPDTRKIIPAVKREIAAAHSAGEPVIYVCDAHAPDDPEFSRMSWPSHAIKGSQGARVVGELSPTGDDMVVEKASYSSFSGTGLGDVLDKFAVREVRLAGCVTHICILFAAYDAALRGYDVSVPPGAVAGLNPEDHDAALRIMKDALGAKIK